MAVTELGPHFQFASWNVPQFPRAIEYPLEVMEEIRAYASDEQLELSHAGNEVGGVLFGVRREDLVRIVTWRPIACEHLDGQVMRLSYNDRMNLAVQLEVARQNPDLKNLRPLGWFVSHLYGVSLSPFDLEIYNGFFPEASQVTLVISPNPGGNAQAGFFMREADGTLRTESSYHSFEVNPLRPTAPPPERAQSAAASSQASIPPSPLAAKSKPPETIPPEATPRESFRRPVMSPSDAPNGQPSGRPAPNVEFPSFRPPVAQQSGLQTPSFRPPDVPAQNFHQPNHPAPNFREPTYPPSGFREPTSGFREPNIREPNVREPNVREPKLREPNLREPGLPVPNFREPNVPRPNFREPHPQTPPLPAPSFGVEEELPTRERWLWLVPVALALGIAGFMLYQRGGSSSSSALALHALGDGRNVQLEWDAGARAVRSSYRGEIAVSDGTKTSQIALSSAQLHAGKLTYLPQSGDVDFAMTIFPTNGEPVHDSTRFLAPNLNSPSQTPALTPTPTSTPTYSTPPISSLPLPAAAPVAEQHDALAQQVQQLRADLSKERARADELQNLVRILENRLGMSGGPPEKGRSR